jgi:hypothetical protein
MRAQAEPSTPIVALRLFGFEVNTEQRLDMEIRKIIDRAAAVLGR